VNRNGRIEKTSDDGQTWQPASAGLQVPWPRNMVERFLATEKELLGVLSSGELLAAPFDTLNWQPLLPDLGDARALAIAIQ
jgi:hypothetical protein